MRLSDNRLQAKVTALRLHGFSAHHRSPNAVNKNLRKKGNILYTAIFSSFTVLGRRAEVCTYVHNRCAKA